MPKKRFIEAENISYAYPSYDGMIPPLVLDGVSMSICEGEIVAVLGHNGSGKSTLAKHFNSILIPASGKVTVDGMDTASEEKLYEIRQEVGMYDYRERAPYQLSGGQKQRVAIAGIIAMRPKCVVLDEPTAMLDPKGRDEVMSTIRQLNGEFGITVVLITHYMDEAAQCGRVVVLDDGKILLDGAPKEVFSQVDLLRRHGLDVPQAAQLCHELRQAGLDLPEGVLTERECVEAIAALFGKGALA